MTNEGEVVKRVRTEAWSLSSGWKNVNLKTLTDPVFLLGPDNLNMIFDYLTVVDLASCALTCKAWGRVAEYQIQNRACLYLGGTFDYEDGPELTDKGLISLLKRMKLTNLNIANRHWIEYGGLIPTHIINVIRTEHGERLVKLSVSGVTIKEGPALTLFQSLPNLTHLALSDCTFFTEQVLHTILDNCKLLEHLDISKNAGVTGFGACFKECLPASLKYLNIAETYAVDYAWEILLVIADRCLEIEMLDITDCWRMTATSYPFHDMKSMPSLKTLRMSNMLEVLDAELRQVRLLDYTPLLAKLPGLERLELRITTDTSPAATPIHEELIKGLIEFCPNFRSLDISGWELQTYRKTYTSRYVFD